MILSHDTEVVFDVTRPLVLKQRENVLHSLQSTFNLDNPTRQLIGDGTWISKLEAHLDALVLTRLGLVGKWIETNVSRFPADNADIRGVYRAFGESKEELKMSVQLCKSECHACQLLCVRGRHHEGNHDCKTSHKCVRSCEYSSDMVHKDTDVACTLPYVASILLRMQGHLSMSDGDPY